MVDQYGWIKKIRKGDILKSRNGTLRVVRRVKHNTKNDSLSQTIVWFAIRHCSWTGRCYTLYSGNDLKQMGYNPVTVNGIVLKAKPKPFDEAIEREFDRPGPTNCQLLSCCDVRGVA